MCVSFQDANRNATNAGVTFVCVKDDEHAQLAQASGGVVVRAWEMDEKDLYEKGWLTRLEGIVVVLDTHNPSKESQSPKVVWLGERMDVVAIGDLAQSVSMLIRVKAGDNVLVEGGKKSKKMKKPPVEKPVDEGDDSATDDEEVVVNADEIEKKHRGTQPSQPGEFRNKRDRKGSQVTQMVVEAPEEESEEEEAKVPLEQPKLALKDRRTADGWLIRAPKDRR